MIIKSAIAIACLCFLTVAAAVVRPALTAPATLIVPSWTCKIVNITAFTQSDDTHWTAVGGKVLCDKVYANGFEK